MKSGKTRSIVIKSLLLVLCIAFIFGNTVQGSGTYNIYGIHFYGDGAENLKNGKGMYSVEVLYTDQYNKTNDRAKLQNIVNKGFRVILRIDYKHGQTVPAENDWVGRYNFAQSCKTIAQDVGDLVNIYVIGNEMQADYEGKIPALWYTYCFNDYDTNCVYDQIKAVRPGAIVCMGALSGWPGYDHEPTSNISFMNTFLANVEAVDGFALHAYSGTSYYNGTGGIEDPRYSDTTGLHSFSEFMKKIYAKYGATKPVYITEANTYWGLNPSVPAQFSDKSYRDNWMKEAFQAIDEWNASNDIKVDAFCWFTYSTLGITDPNSDIFGNAMARTDNAKLTRAREDFNWVTSNTNMVPGTPGSTLKFQAENYSNSDNWNNTNGVEGTDYHDLSSGNTGGEYRYENVDIGRLPDWSGFFVGWFDAGEWLRYTTLAGGNTYKIKLRYSRGATGNGQVHFTIDGNAKGGNISLPGTGSWDTYQEAYSTSFTMPAGFHDIKLYCDVNGVNVDWFEFVKQ